MNRGSVGKQVKYKKGGSTSKKRKTPEMKSSTKWTTASSKMSPANPTGPVADIVQRGYHSWKRAKGDEIPEDSPYHRAKKMAAGGLCRGGGAATRGMRFGGK